MAPRPQDPSPDPPPADQPDDQPQDDHSSLHGGGEAGVIIGAIIVLAILAFIAWFVYSRLRARRLGLPPPGLNPFSDRNRIPGSGGGGIVAWVQDKIGATRRQRTAGGAYEGHAGGGGSGFGGGPGGRNARGQRAFGGLDPDEAWDARVGNEADGYGYEEQELSLRDQPPHNEASRYGRLGVGGSDGHGRSELDDRYDEEMGRKSPARNPFDDAEPSNLSTRGASPRRGDGGRTSNDSTGTNERKSVFREAV